MSNRDDNVGPDSPAAKKAEAAARERAATLDENVTLESLKPGFEKAANQDRQPNPSERG